MQNRKALRAISIAIICFFLHSQLAWAYSPYPYTLRPIATAKINSYTDNWEEDGSLPAKRAFLDGSVLAGATLVSIIYLLCYSASLNLLFINMDIYFLPVFILSIILHEVFHWLTIKRYKNLDYRFFINMEGVYFKVNATGETPFKRIIFAGIIGSGTISLATCILNLFVPSPYLVLASIINAIFASSPQDFKQFFKIINFEEANPRLFNFIRMVKIDLFRWGCPIIILIGGYFASGKGKLVYKLQEESEKRLGRKIKVISGDNWLFSTHKRKGSNIYPYDKYEIRRWKQAVKRAANSEPIFVPFYIQNLRRRLGVPVNKNLPYIKEAGYKLLSCDVFKDKKNSEFLPPGYVERMIKKVEKVWANKGESRTKSAIVNHLRELNNKPLRELLISPESQLYVDIDTGDILEKVTVKPNDIIIFEFEQALTFEDIRKLADIMVFVEASPVHRDQYFKERRSKGLRYPDMDEDSIEEKLRNFHEREEKDILFKKGKKYADIVVNNDEKLGEIILNGEEETKEETQEKASNKIALGLIQHKLPKTCKEFVHRNCSILTNKTAIAISSAT